MAKFAPTTGLSAIINEWGSYYVKRIQDVFDGTWSSTDVWGGFDSGMLRMLPFANMPDDVKDLATETINDIRVGKNKIFVGPLSDQGGKIQVAATQAIDDAGLLSMRWLLEGIQGKLS
jgi:simple sugar transport system substrate-binding protein